MKEINLIEGSEIVTSELVAIFGTEKQRASYEKTNKLLKLTKESILREARTYCNLEEVGGRPIRFKILEVYETKKDKTSKTGRSQGSRANNSVFTEDFDILMCNLLTDVITDEFKGSKLEISKSRLYREMSMVNDNYRAFTHTVPTLAKSLDVTEEDVYECYDNTSIRLRETTERNLTRMRREALIMWSSDVKVCVRLMEIKKNQLGTPLIKKGKPVFEIIEQHRLATTKEKELILIAEKRVLEYMGLRDKQSAFLGKKWSTFKRKVEEELELMETGIDYYYDVYVIVANREALMKKLEEKLDKVSIEEVKTNINKKILDSLYRSTKKRHEKAKKLKEEEGGDAIEEWGEYMEVCATKLSVKEKKQLMRASEDYLEKQTKIEKALIYRNAKITPLEIK